MTERVSILIRSSARPELADALASRVAQTHRNLEVVIVNVTGRPHPRLPEPAAALDVKLVDSDRQLPRPLAANRAIDAATGDFIALLDDDDLFEPEHLERCLAVARAHPDAVPFTGAQIADDKGELQAVWPAFGFGRLELIERIKMQINAPLVARKILSDDLRFDPSLPIFEDWDFWIRLSQRMPFRPVPQLTAIVRSSAGSSGTGAGANFDLERTSRESRPFHAKWDPTHSALQREFESHVGEAKAAAEARDWTRAERHCWDAQALRIWDPVTLAMLSRIFESRRDAAHAKRLAAAAERARWLNPPPLTHAALFNLYARLRRGTAYAQVGEIALAEREFMGAIALHEGDQTACNGMANLRLAEGRLGDAEEFLRQATLWGDRIYPTLLLKRGNLLEQLGRRDEARRIYAQLVTLAPRYAPARGRLQALDAIAAAAA
jgi:hypothetical protein